MHLDCIAKHKAQYEMLERITREPSSAIGHLARQLVAQLDCRELGRGHPSIPRPAFGGCCGIQRCKHAQRVHADAAHVLALRDGVGTRLGCFSGACADVAASMVRQLGRTS